MTDLRQAATLALEALLLPTMKTQQMLIQRDEAIIALRRALEQQAEPVAWMDREGDLYKMPEIKNWAPPHTMLYTTPPQRQWVGLTDDEIAELYMSNTDRPMQAYWEFTRAIEAKLKERNNG